MFPLLLFALLSLTILWPTLLPSRLLLQFNLCYIPPNVLFLLPLHAPSLSHPHKPIILFAQSPLCDPSWPHFCITTTPCQYLLPPPDYSPRPLSYISFRSSLTSSPPNLLESCSWMLLLGFLGSTTISCQSI